LHSVSKRSETTCHSFRTIPGCWFCAQRISQGEMK
jgi:hypothetical protein